MTDTILITIVTFSTIIINIQFVPMSGQLTILIKFVIISLRSWKFIRSKFEKSFALFSVIKIRTTIFIFTQTIFSARFSCYPHIRIITMTMQKKQKILTIQIKTTKLFTTKIKTFTTFSTITTRLLTKTITKSIKIPTITTRILRITIYRKILIARSRSFTFLIIKTLSRNIQSIRNIQLRMI